MSLYGGLTCLLMRVHVFSRWWICLLEQCVPRIRSCIQFGLCDMTLRVCYSAKAL